MANRTDPTAKSVHGTNPQNLIEKILRTRIYSAKFWKEQCFGLTAATLVDKAMELNHIGGTYGGNRKPTNFLCLVLKMLQIQPEKEIVIEFIKNEDYRYVRLLGAFYLRLVARPVDVYQYLEPLYNDYRKVRFKSVDGGFKVTHVDEVIEELLAKDYSCDIVLHRLPKRYTLELAGSLERRISALEDDYEDEDQLEQEQEEVQPEASPEKEKEKEEKDEEDDKDKKKKKIAITVQRTR